MGFFRCAIYIVGMGEGGVSLRREWGGWGRRGERGKYGKFIVRDLQDKEKGDTSVGYQRNKFVL